ncbi:MAG: hypothetical protein ACFFCS_13755 [Candidatus Hodarchaeota archaeon]
MTLKTRKVCNFSLLSGAIFLSILCCFAPNININLVNAPIIDSNSDIQPSGTLDWQTTWGSAADNAVGESITKDVSGNIYITGSNNTGSQDIIVLKLNSAGNEIWNATWAVAGTGNKGNDVCVDTSGNVYIAGQYDDGSGLNACVVMFNSSGYYQWNATYGGSANDQANGIVVDATGNCYAVGSTNTDIFIIKIASNGTIVEDKIFSVLGGDSHSANDIAMDSSGIYVTGHAGNDSKKEAILMKFDTNLTSVANATWGVSKNSYGLGVTVGLNNKVYVTGYNDSDTSDKDLFLLRFPNTVTGEDWAKRWTAGASSISKGESVDVDSDGDIYVIGSSDTTYDKVLLQKYYPNGTLVYSKNWGGVTADDGGKGIYVDKSNDKVFITGYTNTIASGGVDILLLKYLADEDGGGGNGGLDIPWDWILIIGGIAGGAFVAVFVIKYALKKRDEIKVID